jgi:hypothetical protein
MLQNLTVEERLRQMKSEDVSALFVEDSRALFDPETTRKPYEWADIGGPDSLTPEQQQAIDALPRVDIPSGTGPTEDLEAILPSPLPGVEFVAVTDGMEFYVNTEGYNYARYAMKIPTATEAVVGTSTDKMKEQEQTVLMNLPDAMDLDTVDAALGGIEWNGGINEVDGGVDVLVAPEDADAARAALQEAGFTIQEKQEQADDDLDLPDPNTATNEPEVMEQGSFSVGDQVNIVNAPEGIPDGMMIPGTIKGGPEKVDPGLCGGDGPDGNFVSCQGEETEGDNWYLVESKDEFNTTFTAWTSERWLEAGAAEATEQERGEVKTLTQAGAEQINQSAGRPVVAAGDQVTIVDPTPDEGGFMLAELPDGSSIGVLPEDFEESKMDEQKSSVITVAQGNAQMARDIISVFGGSAETKKREDSDKVDLVLPDSVAADEVRAALDSANIAHEIREEISGQADDGMTPAGEFSTAGLDPEDEPTADPERDKVGKDNYPGPDLEHISQKREEMDPEVLRQRLEHLEDLLGTNQIEAAKQLIGQMLSEMSEQREQADDYTAPDAAIERLGDMMNWGASDEEIIAMLTTEFGMTPEQAQSTLGDAKEYAGA